MNLNQSQQVSKSRVNGPLTLVQNIHIDGSALGRGIYTYESWLDMASQDNWSAAQSAVHCTGPHSIDRTRYEDPILAEVDSWMASDTRNLHVITLAGKHGTGLSWLAYRISHALYGRPDTPQIYVVDDRVWFTQTRLHQVLEGALPAILIIDDADQQQALDPLDSARQLPVLAICTGTNRGYLDLLRALSTSGHQNHVELPTWPQTEELQSLEEAYGSPPLTRHDRQFLRRGTLRSAARRLGSGDTAASTARRLVGSVAESSRSTMNLLLASTAADVLLPQTLLLRACPTPQIPGDVSPWVHRRTYLESQGEFAYQLWVEDQEVAELARKFFDQEGDIAPATREMLDSQTFSQLTALAATSAYAGESDFVRRLLRTVLPEKRRQIVRSSAESIARLVNNEVRTESLVAWLSLLKSVNATDLIPEDIGGGQSRLSGAGLLLWLTEQGADEDRPLTDSVRGLLQWDAPTWRRTLEVIQHLPGPMRNQAARKLVLLLRQQHELDDLLTSGGTLQLLLKLLEPRGEPQGREWLLRHALATGPGSHMARDLFSLAERCITQGRSALALRLLHAHFRGEPYQDAEGEYKELEIAENGSSWGERSTEWCTARLSTERPSKAILGWHNLLEFSSTWTPESFDIHWSSALSALERANNDLSLYERRNFLQSLAHFFARGHPIPVLAHQRYLLAGLNSSEIVMKDAQRYIKSVAGHALMRGPLGDAARDALEALFIARGGALQTVLEQFNECASDVLAVKVQSPRLLFKLDNEAGRRLTYTLVSANKSIAPESQSVTLASAVDRWSKRRADMRAQLVFWALRTQEIERYKHLLRPDSSPNDATIAAAAYAAMGDTAAAEKYLREATPTNNYASMGAHFHSIHRATFELAKAREGAAGQTYATIANLVTTGPMPPFPAPAQKTTPPPGPLPAEKTERERGRIAPI